MNDYAFCNNSDCPLKDNCWRYIQGMNAKGDNWWTEGEWDGKMCKLYLGN